MDLKPGMENVHVTVRVLESGETKVIRTRVGERTISEAIVGDESGRVKLTLWGKAAGTLNVGDVVDLQGCWTSAFRGNVQLNVGGRGKIEVVEDDKVPPADQIPEDTPKAPEDYRRPYRRGGYRRGSYGSGRRGW
jgi:replication factor A1